MSEKFEKINEKEDFKFYYFYIITSFGKTIRFKTPAKNSKEAYEKANKNAKNMKTNRYPGMQKYLITLEKISEE